MTNQSDLMDWLPLHHLCYFLSIMEKSDNGTSLGDQHGMNIHLQPYYRKKYGFKKGDFPVSESFYKKEVSLPIYYSLKKKEALRIAKNIKSFCEKK